MSLSPHQRGNISNVVKQTVEEVEGEVFYNAGTSSFEQTHSSGGRVDPSFDLQGSAGFKPEKAYPVWGHFQQSGPVKWVHQEPMQTSNWFQGVQNPAKLTQNYGPSLTGIDDTQAHQGLRKTNQDLDALQQEKMSAGSSMPFPESSQALAPGVEWDHHTMAAMHHAQFQALQQGHKPGDPQYQPHATRHAVPDSTLQPFQLAFGATKQPQASGFFQTFHSSSAPQNLGYSEQPKSQQLLHLQQQQHQMQHLQQMRQLQQQQRLHHMQQYHHQKKLQEHLQQMQLQQQNRLQQPESLSSQVHQQEQRLARLQQQDGAQLKADSSTSTQQRPSTATPPQTQPSSVEPDPGPASASQEPEEQQIKPQSLPRRSRRLSKDGLSPVSSQPPKESARNGGTGSQGPSGGVIQSTQRRRRASKEINLETLAQKASEMEFLPAKCDEGREAGTLPLVIPVSVPVQKSKAQTDQAGSWSHKQQPLPESVQQQYPYERKPSVIVARRRSLRNSASDTFNQDEGKEDGKSSEKIKRRPRPEPLVIPPPKPCTFIAPSVYSSITSYQSHLRSPVRSLDHPLTLPPYTPPPILSPVREGTGLYFSAFLSSIAAGNQGLPPASTPKTTSRSLLRSSSCDVTPPVLPLIGEATPVSLEPRINIGPRYQAEIPELQDLSLAQQDQHKATLLFLPLAEAESTPSQKNRVDNLMNMASSSVLYGGGTNLELVHHCLHESKGDIVKTLEMLLLQQPVFSHNHHLANYHYAGSDCWNVDEKNYFNKGITAYRKDFFLVQKLVRSKTVAQCVEYYYTYKKQVKVSRNGTLTFGPPDPKERPPETIQKQNKIEEPEDNKQDVQKVEPEDSGGVQLQTVTQAFQFEENVDKVLVLSIPKMSSGDEAKAPPRLQTQTPPSALKPHQEGTGKRAHPSAPPKTQGEPEGIFPCKKCTRVFYKVKSRSAHMKSHAEQEKKAAAAAQRQREEEEQAAAKAILLRIRARPEGGRDGEEEQDESSEPEDQRDEDWA